MNMPFTTEQFFQVFESYNLAIWPMQVVAYLLALSAVVLALKPIRFSNRIICGILAFFWTWIGVAYHILHFAEINKAAYAFGALFVLQGILLFLAGILKGRLSFTFRPGVTAVVGALFIAYAMVFYPIIGAVLGHGYPRSPSFGVTPCPAAIFTFGLLLWTDKRVPRYVLWIPLLWSLIGFSAALTLKVREDMALLVAGLLGVALILLRDKRRLPQE